MFKIQACVWIVVIMLAIDDIECTSDKLSNFLVKTHISSEYMNAIAKSKYSAGGNFTNDFFCLYI